MQIRGPGGSQRQRTFNGNKVFRIEENLRCLIALVFNKKYKATSNSMIKSLERMCRSRDLKLKWREIVFNFYEQSTSTVSGTIQERGVHALTVAFLAAAFLGAAFLVCFLAPAFLVAFLAAFLGAACFLAWIFFGAAAALFAIREIQVSIEDERQCKPRQSIIKAYTLRLYGIWLAPGRLIVRCLTSIILRLIWNFCLKKLRFLSPDAYHRGLVLHLPLLGLPSLQSSLKTYNDVILWSVICLVDS